MQEEKVNDQEFSGSLKKPALLIVGSDGRVNGVIRKSVTVKHSRQRRPKGKSVMARSWQPRKVVAELNSVMTSSEPMKREPSQG